MVERGRFVAKSNRSARHEAAKAAAALRARQQQQRRRRFVWAGTAVGVVLVVVLALVFVKVIGGGSPSGPSAQASPTPAPTAVTAVPSGVLDQVALGKVDSLPKAITGQPALTANGKPLVLYVGAEYCPFCAAQRWGMVVALSRFGTFTGLNTTHSASQDVFPNTATLSFHGATYTSNYLTFQGVETQSNVRQGNSYAPLDTLTADQSKTFNTYDAAPYVSADSAGSIPFVDFGNKYLTSGASISPQLLAGESASDIAAALSDPSSPIAQAVDGSANAFTAAICQLTGGQPGAVCTSAGVTAYQGKLSGG
jgi:Domain of unknown function (DUF929)